MAKNYNYLCKTITLPDGRRKYIRAKTQKELEKKFIQFKVNMATGDFKVDSTTTVRELTELWLKTVKKPTVTPQSYSTVESILRLHLVDVIGDMKVCDVKPIHIRNTINNHGFKAKDSNRRLVAFVRAVFAFAIENEMIHKSPVPDKLSVPGSDAKEEIPLTPTETMHILSVSRQDWYDGYIYTLLGVTTGMRSGELVALRWDCVDLQNRVIHVRRNYVFKTKQVCDTVKTDAGYRDIPIPEDVNAVLRELKSSSNSIYVITHKNGGHITYSDVQHYERVWNRDGLIAVHVHPHLLRKTYATRLIESGADPKRAQYLLGHATLEMTLKVYAKYDERSQQSVTAKLVDATFTGLAVNA